MTDFRIMHGSALDVLRAMEPESVQCCITSPPYYGLRAYGTPPQVWGNHNGCGHEWGDAIAFVKQDNRTAEQKAAQGANVGSNINFNEKTTTATSGSFCVHCNAWRGELGLEPTFHLYLDHLIEIFAEVKRVLKADGVCFVNLGDSYAGGGGGNYGTGVSNRIDGQHITNVRNRPDFLTANNMQPKSLMNIPARFAIRMTDELQFVLRNELIWHKPACMPSSAKDRFTVDFEPIFFFSKGPRYKFNQQLEPVQESSIKRVETGWKSNHDSVGKNGIDVEVMGDRWANPEGRNKRTVWTVTFEPQSNEHYASYPTKLIEPMIFAGTDAGDTVLDPFAGTGTTGLVALRNQRRYIGIELQEKYIAISEKRLKEVQVGLFV